MLNLLRITTEKNTRARLPNGQYFFKINPVIPCGNKKVTRTQTCCVCLKSKKLRNLSSSFLHHFSGIMGNSEQKKYFADHWTANATQLFVAIEGHFFWSVLFLNNSQRRGIPHRLLDKCSNLFIYTSLK